LARIVAISDTFDAMTSDRPYRQGMTHARAMELLQEGAGRQWDRELVGEFAQLPDDILGMGAPGAGSGATHAPGGYATPVA
jgi:HD-GYP domain-containing protein (c-di-GMP phosphodiesterase class II)